MMATIMTAADLRQRLVLVECPRCGRAVYLPVTTTTELRETRSGARLHVSVRVKPTDHDCQAANAPALFAEAEALPAPEPAAEPVAAIDAPPDPPGPTCRARTWDRQQGLQWCSRTEQHKGWHRSERGHTWM